MPANMADYITVAERLAAAKDDILHIAADLPTMLDGSMGYIRVAVSLKDGRSATGTASFRLDLTGKGAQATNPIEDCETSAVGRALALLGYHSSRSIASREEVAEAQRREQQERKPVQLATPRARPITQEDRHEAEAIEESRVHTVARIRKHMERAKAFGFNDQVRLGVNLDALSIAQLAKAEAAWEERVKELAAQAVPQAA